MKKALSLLLAGVLCVGLLAGCGGQNSESQSSSTSSTNSTTSSASSTDSSANSTDSSTSTTASSETSNKKIDTLRIAFVPSREPEEIITATEPLKQMLTDELATLGYDVGEVDITVGTSYEAVGEALSAGTADVGLIPGGTYVLYDDGCDVLLTATRDGLSIDSDNAKDWNDNAPTEPTTEQVTSYRALMIAGPSEKGKELAAKAASAASGEELVEAYYEQRRAFADYNTAANLANIHYTCDTRDAYWKAEQDFFDANGPAVQNASVEISRAFLANPHVDALTEAFGTTCVAGMKNAVLGMDDRTVELQKEYNALVSQYQQVYGGALVELDGKQLTIPQLGPYKENLDPAVRRAAYEAEAGYFDAHRAELDELYTKIVKNLNEQARILGYHDYSELSYVRMNRIGYGPEEIKRFRDQVANDVVPQLQKVIELRRKRTGIEHPTFADLPVTFKDGNPDRKSTRLNSSHSGESRMPSSA